MRRDAGEANGLRVGEEKLPDDFLVHAPATDLVGSVLCGPGRSKAFRASISSVKKVQSKTGYGAFPVRGFPLFYAAFGDSCEPCRADATLASMKMLSFRPNGISDLQAFTRERERERERVPLKYPLKRIEFRRILSYICFPDASRRRDARRA
jgi:hypothetical protein